MISMPVALVLLIVISKLNYHCMLGMSLLVLGVTVDGQECPNDTSSIVVSDDESVDLPLTVPACFLCGYLVGSGINTKFITPTDVTWRRSRSGIETPLTNGTDGVLINPDTTELILNNPGDVISVGDTLRCNSQEARDEGHSTGEYVIIIIPFGEFNTCMY